MSNICYIDEVSWWDRGQRIMFCIDLSAVESELTVTPDVADLDLDASELADVQAVVTLVRTEDRIRVTVDAAATATLTCDRTGVRFTQPIAGAYHALLVEAGQEAPDHDEVIILEKFQKTINLTHVVRDTLLLAIPIRKVAPGAEALDIPTVFGGEAAVDPRWDALRALLVDAG